MKDPAENGKPQMGFMFQNFGTCFWALARMVSFGAHKKYKPFDWRTRDQQYFIDKLSRHWLQVVNDPTEKDEETGEYHIVAVLFHAFCLLYKIQNDTQRNKGTIEDSVFEVPMSFEEWREDCGFVLNGHVWFDKRGYWSGDELRDLYKEYVDSYPNPQAP